MDGPKTVNATFTAGFQRAVVRDRHRDEPNGASGLLLVLARDAHQTFVEVVTGELVVLHEPPLREDPEGGAQLGDQPAHGRLDSRKQTPRVERTVDRLRAVPSRSSLADLVVEVDRNAAGEGEQRGAQAATLVGTR